MRFHSLLLLSLSLTACGSSSPADAGPDVATDVATDVTTDAGRDVPIDAGRDVPIDAGRDVPTTDAPIIDVPVIDTPVIDVRATDTPTTDALTTDTPTTDAPTTDTPTADAPTADVAASDRPEPFCDIPAVYTYGPDGGLVAFRDTFTIEPGRRFTYTRVGGGRVDAGPATCTTTIDYCGTSDGGTVDTLALINALNDADVMAAFADQARTVYGRDSRPVDGQVFGVTRGDGRHFEVGGDCAGATGCRAIPAGLARLRDVLTNLQTQQLARPECAAVRP